MELRDRYLRAKRALFDRVYGTLNDAQREAVFSTRGPLLVLAGAGSGKTTVLVKRIAFIIKYGNAYYSSFVPYSLTEERVIALERACREYTPEQIETLLPQFTDEPCKPWQMLAITFTNKAAGEIKSRLVSTFGDESIASDIWSGTFHSICMRILRRYGDRVGYAQGFTVYDTEDTKKTLETVMKELGIDEKAKYVASEISKAKENLITPDEYAKEADFHYRQRRVARVYKAYQEKLRACNALDFDDIIMQTIFLLRRETDVREYYQKKFKYVCVDEYQDTNHAQFELTRLLGEEYENVMVVGDDDQSIYKFRGADITNILEFDKTYPTAKIIRLEQNYRSTKPILDAANEVIAHNTGRKGKTLYTIREGGSKIKLRLCDDQNAEANFILDTIIDKVSKGERSYRDFAILYRNNVQSRAIEDVFKRSAVPYRVLGGQRFDDRKEIRDVTAYLQLINNTKDNERLKRIINEPKRKIGQTTVGAIEAIATEQGCSMFEVIRHADNFVALKRTESILLGFARLIDGLRAVLQTDIALDEFFDQVLEKSGYRQMLINEASKDVKEKERIDHVYEFKSAIKGYAEKADVPTLTGFLEENSLVADIDNYDSDADAVVMMTIHSAKGLEFPVVLLPGMEDEIFPSSQSIQNIFSSGDEMEEERRLAYVAITRAKDELFFLHTQRRILYGRTLCNPVSRFVGEISESLIDKEPKRKSEWQTAMENARFQQHSAADNFKREKVTVASSVFTKPAQSAPKETFREGDIVTHMTFGRGEILSVRPMGADTLYEVAFDKVGTKKLMATYARLKKM